MVLAIQRDWVRVTSLLCTVLLLPGDAPLMAQQPAPQASTPTETAPPVSADQLDSLVAPVALYPDPLLAQVLAASTYPLEVVQLQQWLSKHANMNEKALADAVQKENWDPSVQGLAALPDVVKQLSENISWTSELGNAFLAQESGVMDAVQRMRSKAKDGGKLKSTEQIKVETKVVESKSVVVIEQANPQVVYVPSYDPVVVWGAPPVYAYPPIAYPPVGYYAAGMALSFGVGVAMGAMWHGGWGYGCGWGGNNSININNNNNFVNNGNRNNINGGNRNNVGNGNRGNGNSNWSHNPQHRGGAPYGDRGTANKFGGNARGDSLGGNRQASAQKGLSQRSGGQSFGAGGAGNAGANRGGAGGVGNAGGNRGGAGGAGNAGANRGSAGGAGSGNRGAAGGGGDRVGNRQVPSGGGSRSSGAFGGGGGGMNGSSARSSSSRGSSSYGGGGGSRGGGSRGGGGGRRR